MDDKLGNSLQRQYNELASNPKSMAEQENTFLKKQLEESMKKVAKYEQAIEDANKEPGQLVRFIRLVQHRSGKTMVLIAAGMSVGMMETSIPLGKFREVKPGTPLKSTGDCVTDIVPMLSATGPTFTVKDVLSDGRIVCDAMGSNRVFDVVDVKFEKGDVAVVLDGIGIAVENLGKPAVTVKPSESKVTWANIGGQEVAKKALQDAIETPVKFDSLYRKYGKRRPKGVLLYGPPGCGKTMLAKAVLSSIAETYGDHDSAFLYVKGPELLSKWVGQSEEGVRGLFIAAREHHTKHGYPAIIFIDEGDALLGRRGRADHGGGSLTSTIVPQFLAEMDGLDASSAIVIIATNQPDQLDPAVTREGRVDRSIAVARPDVETAKGIFKMYLSNTWLEKGADLHEMAAYLMFDKNKVLYEIDLVDDRKAQFCFHHLISGAMIENVVEQASTIAMNRDIRLGHNNPSGVGSEDINQAVKIAFDENRQKSHHKAVSDFVEALGEPALNVRKV